MLSFKDIFSEGSRVPHLDSALIWSSSPSRPSQVSGYFPFSNRFLATPDLQYSKLDVMMKIWPARLSLLPSTCSHRPPLKPSIMDWVEAELKKEYFADIFVFQTGIYALLSGLPFHCGPYHCFSTQLCRQICGNMSVFGSSLCSDLAILHDLCSFFLPKLLRSLLFLS